MAVRRPCAVPVDGQTTDLRPSCVSAPTRHYAAQVSQRQRILTFAAWIAVVISGTFGVLQLSVDATLWWIGAVNLTSAAVFALIPWLSRYGDLVAPLTFTCVAYTFTFVIGFAFGTDSGAQFYFLAAASMAVLIIGVERIALATTVAGVGAGLAIALEFLAPADTGAQPAWLLRTGFVMVTLSACLMVVATVWYTLREITRAEAAMESEYERSEALLTNILPASVAERLKNPASGTVADSYPDASVLFADIAGFTRRASQADPGELVKFLNSLYTDLDALVDRHGLEKIKTTGDSYMVVSGVPEPRADHLQALARLALDIAATVAGLRDPRGRPVSLRIGMAAGPVVAGVVGSRRFFYDVWGDAVNLASRMESTGAEGRIQVPQNVYARLAGDFVFTARGEVDVKGKGVIHTWFLVGERDGSGRLPEELSVAPAY